MGYKVPFLAIFQKGPGWPCPDSAALKNSKIIFALGADEFLTMLEGKIREAPFIQVQSGRITV